MREIRSDDWVLVFTWMDTHGMAAPHIVAISTIRRLPCPRHHVPSLGKRIPCTLPPLSRLRIAIASNDGRGERAPSQAPHRIA